MSVFTIPDLLSKWAWGPTENDMYEDVRHEATQWVESLRLFEPSQFAKFEACNFNLLASFVGPLESKDHLRVACDLLSFFFAFDEYTDVANAEQAKGIITEVMHTLHTRPLNPTENRIAEMARQFILNVVSLHEDESEAINRFVADFESYANAVCTEAEERNQKVVRNVDDYFALRRHTCGAFPTFSFFAIGLGIPSHVLDHPAIQSLTESATDLIAVINDMHSYALEYARGLSGHNVVTSIMYEFKLDVQGAMYWLSGYAARTISSFDASISLLPSWGPDIDAALKEYIDRMGRCVRGYDSWSYRTQRYYGNSGPEVRKSRRITLRRKEAGYVAMDELARRIGM